MANSVFIQQGGLFSSSINIAGDVTATGRFYAGDGTSALPSFSFTSEPTLGFRRSSAGIVTLQGSLSASGNIEAGTISFLLLSGRLAIASSASGVANITTTNLAIGSQLKVDALPTVTSGFGTSPAITAGSTPLAGSIDVGTGGIATTGVIAFNGTAFPSAPKVVVTCSAGAVPTVAVATTTSLTLTTSVAWPASTIVNWIAISSK